VSRCVGVAKQKGSDAMLAFEISIDGERFARAGFADWSVLSAHVTAVQEGAGRPDRKGELEFSVGGLSKSNSDGAQYHVRWSKRQLTVGSKITVEIVETEDPDEPERRYRSDREVQESPYSDEEIEQFEREEWERLKAKFHPVSESE
jgi:hypothetical protein